MKYRILRSFVRLRRWANTEQGEKFVVKVLTTMFLILIADIALLVVGMILS